ncbi:MAG: class I SAM-dependent methyltransferase [Patescibacteria group bacterium]
MPNKKNFYEHQYLSGETKGPYWYQLLSQYVTDREAVTVELIQSYIPRPTHYLDVGCGEGKLVAKVAQFSKQATGIDIATNRLEIAKKQHTAQNLRFKTSDFEEKLLFANNSFDAVSCLSVLEYVFDPYFSMSELYRITKPNGYLVVSVPNIAFLPERLKLLLGYLPSWPEAEGWQGGRLHAFTCDSLRKLGKETGFKVKQTTGSGFLQRIRSKYPALLCGDCICVFQK